MSTPPTDSQSASAAGGLSLDCDLSGKETCTDSTLKLLTTNPVTEYARTQSQRYIQREWSQQPSQAEARVFWKRQMDRLTDSALSDGPSVPSMAEAIAFDCYRAYDTELGRDLGAPCAAGYVDHLARLRHIICLESRGLLLAEMLDRLLPSTPTLLQTDESEQQSVKSECVSSSLTLRRSLRPTSIQFAIQLLGQVSAVLLDPHGNLVTVHWSTKSTESDTPPESFSREIDPTLGCDPAENLEMLYAFARLLPYDARFDDVRERAAVKRHLAPPLCTAFKHARDDSNWNPFSRKSWGQLKPAIDQLSTAYGSLPPTDWFHALSAALGEWSRSAHIDRSQDSVVRDRDRHTSTKTWSLPQC